MDKQNLDDLIETNIGLGRFRQTLERMISGAFCLHRSFGIGQIKSYDKDKSRLVIQFAEGEPRLMDPVFCIKKLEILRDDDLLVQFHKNPDEIRQKLKKSSISLLMEFLTNLPNRRASLGDIEKTFGEIVDGKVFKRWWNVTKKLVAKEPRLELIEGNVTYVRLCDEPIAEDEQLMQKFEAAREFSKKIIFAEKFLTLCRSNPGLKESAESMIKYLSDVCTLKLKKITPAEKFQAYVIRDELAKLVGINTDTMSPKLENLIAEFQNLGKVCDALPAAYYNVFLSLVTRVFPDEWEKLCFSILRNCNEKLTHECIVYLKDNGCTESLKSVLIKWLKEKSLRASLLQWIIKNRHSKKFEDIFSPELMSYELLRSIFWAIDNEALAGTGKLKKIPLVELLCNDRSLIKDLLGSASDEVVSDLAQTLLINQGIDNLSKKSLLARFIAVFPGVQGLILNAIKTKVPQDVSIKVSLSSLESKRKEYDILIKEKIPNNKKSIEIAREHGDLSENSEYKMARQDQETLLSRKAQLEDELRMAQVIDLSTVDTSMVSIGCVVTVRQINSGETVDFTILGAWDSDPVKNIISYKTNMAQSLLGKREKDVVEIVADDHKESWQVEAIRPYDKAI